MRKTIQICYSLNNNLNSSPIRIMLMTENDFKLRPRKSLINEVLKIRNKREK